jgi:hypothetical protein
MKSVISIFLVFMFCYSQLYSQDITKLNKKELRTEFEKLSANRDSFKLLYSQEQQAFSNVQKLILDRNSEITRMDSRIAVLNDSLFKSKRAILQYEKLLNMEYKKYDSLFQKYESILSFKDQFVLLKGKYDSIQSMMDSQSYPALPYIQKNSCPGEGCRFGDWIANENVKIFSEQNKQSVELTTIKSGEHITALEGEMIISQFGKVKISKAFNDFKPGEIILILSYIGEGYYSIWKDEMEKQVFIFWDDELSSGQEIKGEKFCDTVSTWWVKVRMKSGLTGWVDGSKSSFKGADAFG